MLLGASGNMNIEELLNETPKGSLRLVIPFFNYRPRLIYSESQRERNYEQLPPGPCHSAPNLTIVMHLFRLQSELEIRLTLSPLTRDGTPNFLGFIARFT